jgi:spore germination protein
MKKKLILLIAGVISFFVFSFLAYAAAPIKIFVNKIQLFPDPPPFITEGRVMMPVRAVLDPLGAGFSWDAKNKVATVTKGFQKVILKINKEEATVNGVKYILDAPATVIQGRTFIPIRFVAEHFDALVEWNGSNKTVQVTPNGLRHREIVMTGYYFDYRSLESLEKNKECLNDTIHFSYSLNSEARVVEKPFFDQGFEFARRNGLGIEMLVFANDREQLKKIMNNREMQQVIIEDIYGYLTSRGFDGVNIDFEYIDKSQAKQYNDFIKSLSNKLGSEYTLSLSVPARSADREYWYDGYDYAALASIADRVIVMAYDQHYPGSEPGPVAGCDWVEKVIKYMLPLIPKEKFQLGLGIYGYDWPQGEKGKSIYIQAARDLAAEKKVDIIEDASSGVSRFSYVDDKGISHQVWFENDSSVQTKLQLVKKYQLSGVGLWRLGIIPQDIWEILKQFKSS